MRTTTRLNILAALLALAVALTALPALAQPDSPHRPLHPKSEAGLMPPAYILAPDEQVVRPTAAGVPFLGAPINTAAGGWAQVLAATDLTGDGRAEATVGTGQYFDPANDRQEQVFAWNGGGFNRIERRRAGADPEAAQVVDVNLDGRADLALALPGSNQLAFYTQTPTPTAPISAPLLLAQAGAPDALAAGDFDGDLRNDLATVAPQSGAIRIWRSTPAGPKPTSLLLSYPTGAYNALASGDLNNDGEDDLIALHGSGDPYRGREITVFPQSHGAFAASYTRPVSAGVYLAQSLAVGDLNGDGLDDLAATAGGNMPDAYLNVFLQRSYGLTALPITYPTYHIPSAVAIGDLNHDGRDDVVMVHDGWRTLSVFLQNSSHTLDEALTADIPYSSRFRPSALALADFNGDGGLDVGLVGKEAGLTVLLNKLTAPTATIAAPPEAALLPPGTLIVTGTASPSATRVQVRLRGDSVGWIAAPVVNGTWRATLTLPAEGRPWWIDARAIDDATGRYQAPPAHRRIRVERFAYTVADNDGVTSSPDRLMRVGLSNAHATLVGDTGTEHIEALAFKPGTATLYAADAGQLGTLNLSYGMFTPTSARFGKGRGAKGVITLNHVDGLAFSPAGVLYGVQRRTHSGDKDLLFQIDPISGTVKLNAFGSGKDYVVIDGPNIPSDIDDITFDPATGVLYGSANNGGDSGGALVTINPTNGAATLVHSLGVADMEGLGFTNDGKLYGTTGDDGATRNQLYLIDKQTGSATPIGPLSGQRDYESLAGPPAGVALPLPSGNAALPHVDSVTIDDSAASTADRMVAIQASASAPNGGARWMLFVEQQYDPMAGAWVRASAAPIRSYDWLAYAGAATRYDWQLGATAGVTYLQAWAADSAGRLARLPFQTFINYIPPSDSLAPGGARIYRYTLRAGQQLTAHIDALSGDADLYVWSSDPDAAPWASNLSGGADEVSVVAPADGIYQVEVRGYTAATYKLTVTPSATAAQATVGGIDPNKAPPDRPLAPVDSAPMIRQDPPVGPSVDHKLYLPLVRR